jgi:hypothetical protein
VLFEQLAVLVGRLTDEQPVLFVLDDAHWADHASLLAIRHLVIATSPARVLFLLTYRDTELSRRHPLSDLLAVLRRQGARHITLSGLTGEHVEQLLAGMSQHAVDAAGTAIAHRVHEETGGNPFFVTELMRHLIETDVLAHDNGAWRVDVPLDRLGLPDSVRDIVGRRLSSLPESCDEVLPVIAVIGREADLALITEVSSADAGAVVDAVDAAVHAGLLVEVPGQDRVAFCHAIVREVLHGELTSTRRRRLHERVATSLEARAEPLDEIVPELAMHWREAGATEPAIRFTRRAAELALDRAAYEEAEQLLREALELVPASDERKRAELLLMIGRTCNKSGALARGKEDIWRAATGGKALGDGDLLAEAALSFGGFWSFLFDPADLRGHQLLHDALHGATTATRRAELAASLASLLMPPLEPPHRRQLIASALAGIDPTSDPVAAALTYFRILWAYEIIDDYGDAGLAITDDFIACAAGLADSEWLLLAREWRGRLRLRVGQLDGAQEDLDVRDDLAARLRRPEYLWSAAMRRCTEAMAAGRFDEVEHDQVPAVARAAKVFGEEGSEFWRVRTLADLRALQHRFDEIRGTAEAVSAADPTLRRSVIVAVEADDRSALHELLADGRPGRIFDGDVSTNLLWPVYAARAAVMLGDHASARALLPRFTRWPSAPSSAFELCSMGANSHWAGRLQLLLGDVDAAVDSHALALDQYTRWGHHAWWVHGAWDLAIALHARGSGDDHRRASELETAAAGKARALGIKGRLP